MFVGVAALALVGCLSVAIAAPEPSFPTATARLEFKGKPGCSSREDIAARVVARSPRIRLVEDAAAPSIEATFAVPRTNGVEVDLVVAGSDGKTLSRHLLAGSCAQAADAVALIIAITLDPTSEGEAHDDATGRLPDVIPAPIAKAPAAKSPVTPPVIVASRPIAPPPSTRRHVSVHLVGQMIFGPAPSVMPGAGLAFMVEDDRDPFWSPAIGLGATHAWRQGLSERGGTASFVLDAATLDACAVRVRWAFADVRACAAVLAGRLATAGSDVPDATSFPRPFVTVGGAGLFAVPLGSRFVLRARLSAATPLVRDWYIFGTDTFHRTPRVTIDVGVGVGTIW